MRGSARRAQTRKRRGLAPPIPIGVAANVATVTAPENPLRTGMPALDAIHSRLTIASPQSPGRTYAILRTTEIDSYELEAAMAARVPAPGLLAPVPAGDSFKGTSRKAAKLSIATAAMESFRDLKNLIASLPADRTMVALRPPITTSSTSNRVSKEKRNVRIRAFLYAASRENDNDFHLIVGRDPATSPEMYMTVELSGLPSKTTKSHATLKAARDAYKAFFGQSLPRMTYDFYDPPIPVQIEGSLFFDINHAVGQRPGPQSLKSRIPTIWEVHPITGIAFEP